MTRSAATRAEDNVRNLQCGPATGPSPPLPWCTAVSAASIGSYAAEDTFQTSEDQHSNRTVEAWYPLASSPQATALLARYGLSLIHISEPTRLGMISYAVFCLKKK